MTTVRNARMLVRYNAWADKLIFEAVAALPDGEATKPRTSLFKNIVHTLNHNYVIDLIFQAHLQAREHGFTARNTAEHPALDELWRAQQAVDDWYVAWSDGMTDAALNEKVSFTFVGGGQGVMTRNEILLHVINHTRRITADSLPTFFIRSLPSRRSRTFRCFCAMSRWTWIDS